MKKIFGVLVISSVMLCGCGGDTYKAEGNITVNNEQENIVGQTAVKVEVDPSVEVNANQESDNRVDIEEYNRLEAENATLKIQLQEKIDKLKEQADSAPILDYNSFALSVDGNDIPINKNNSMVTIDGREYVSKEILEKLLDENQNITIQEDTIFIGKVISEKRSLLSDDCIMDQHNIALTDSVRDSYGNNYSNVFLSYAKPQNLSHIIFVLNREYALLKFSAAIRDNSYLEPIGTIIIKADEEVVYISEDLNKKTEPFSEIDIPINNCNLLTIEYSASTYDVDCIISELTVYN